jgi:sulfotransferase
LLVITYETLSATPQAALDAVYDFIGAPRFTHDPESVAYDDVAEFDARLGTPGLHHLAPSMRRTERATVLPPDLFRKFQADSFWRDGAPNPRGVKVV